MSKLIVLRGPPASGKSTISKKLIEDLDGDWVLIPKDVLSINFVFSDYKKYGRDDVLCAIITDCLLKDINVIVEGIFGGKNFRKILGSFDKICKRFEGKIFVVTLDSDLESSHERNKDRLISIPKEDIDKWYKYFYENEFEEGLFLDNDKLSLEDSCDRIRKYIDD